MFGSNHHALATEHLSHDSLKQAAIDWLLGQGVPVTALFEPWPIAQARVEIGPDGCFDRADDGQLAYTFAVLGQGEEIIDLAAWLPKSGRLATWLGRGFALDEYRIDSAWSCALGGALRVFRDPLEWLRNTRRGIVMLPGREREAYARLGSCERLEAEGPSHMRELYKLIAPPAPLVKIVLPERVEVLA